MPHLTLELSDNVLEKHNLPELFTECHSMLVDILPTEIANCKSRSIVANTHYVGNGNKNNAFIHLNLKIMPGRSLETRNRAGNSLMAALKAHFSGSIQALNLQITIEIMELEDTYFKFQNMDTHSAGHL